MTVAKTDLHLRKELDLIHTYHLENTLAALITQIRIIEHNYGQKHILRFIKNEARIIYNIIQYTKRNCGNELKDQNNFMDWE
jgi:hypothetical protein